MDFEVLITGSSLDPDTVINMVNKFVADLQTAGVTITRSSYGSGFLMGGSRDLLEAAVPEISEFTPEITPPV